MIQCDLIHLANSGLCAKVLEDLETFLNALFMTKMSETNAPSITSCVSDSTGEGVWIAHFC